MKTHQIKFKNNYIIVENISEIKNNTPDQKHTVFKKFIRRTISRHSGKVIGFQG